MPITKNEQDDITPQKSKRHRVDSNISANSAKQSAISSSNKAEKDTNQKREKSDISQNQPKKHLKLEIGLSENLNQSQKKGSSAHPSPIGQDKKKKEVEQTKD